MAARPPSRTESGTRRIVNTSKRPTTLSKASTSGIGSLASSQSSLISPPVRSSRGNNENLTDRHGKGKENDGNINVVVRCRGRSLAEISADTFVTATVSQLRGKTVTLTDPSPSVPSSTSSLPSGPSSLLSGSVLAPTPTTRTYDFGDRPHPEDPKKDPIGNVYGPEADQVMLYNQVAKPILEQVLMGYNCTIFAYGQTGTGKTYTMEGDLSLSRGISREAGIIPRTLYSLFAKLTDEMADFTVRCSFIEIYNEELRDLNSIDPLEPVGAVQPMDHNKRPAGRKASSIGTSSLNGLLGNEKKGLRMVDDKNSGTLILGLEETTITTAVEGLKVLKRGSERRQIAATKCNENSSRSHSIFTITVAVKEPSRTGGEDFVKIGKLNLVDLAGSESVGRSGAVQDRQREAGMINKSLLTLGLVINKLVETQTKPDEKQHIPYRASNLTRLLQDSLGGRTKTTIIATISPLNYDETISTLDYALRAKSIQNRPQINQKMTKNLLLSQYAAEIERIKNDLCAARQQNGIYFSEQSWNDLSSQHDQRRIALEESKRALELGEARLDSVKDQLEQTLRLVGVRESELTKKGQELGKIQLQGKGLQQELANTLTQLEEESVLRNAMQLSRRGWKGTALTAINDVDGLTAKIARKTLVEETNLSTISSAHANLNALTENLLSTVNSLKSSQISISSEIKQRMKKFTEHETEQLHENMSAIEQRLLGLESTGISIAKTANEMDARETVFADAVHDIKNELMTSLELRAKSLAVEIEENVLAVLKDLAVQANQASQAIAQMIEPLQKLHTANFARLEQDAQILLSQRDVQQKVLAAENDRLNKVVAQLTATLERERAQAAEEDSELVALLSLRLSARTHRQFSSLDESCALAATDLTKVSQNLSVAAEQEQSANSSLVKSNQTSKSDWISTINKIESVATANRSMLDETNKRLQREIEQIFTKIEADTVSGLEVADKAASSLEVATTQFRSDTATSKIQLDEQINLLVRETQEGYTSALERMVQVGENIMTTTSSVQSDLNSAVSHTNAFHSTATNHLNSLQDSVGKLVSSEIVTDVPTGTTPRKREWPGDQFSHLVDLDAPRNTLVKTLMQAHKNGEIMTAEGEALQTADSVYAANQTEIDAREIDADTMPSQQQFTSVTPPIVPILLDSHAAAIELAAIPMDELRTTAKNKTGKLGGESIISSGLKETDANVRRSVKKIRI